MCHRGPKRLPPSVADPQAFVSEVSDAEQACLLENIDPDRLMLLAGGPDLATEEEGASFMGCLEHGTLLRLFLTPVLDETGPLSPESSACIRDGFAGVDFATLMIADGAESGPSEDPTAAMAGMMAGFFSALSCLNEDELQAASSALGMAPEDLQGLKCVLDELGGPEHWPHLCNPTLALLSCSSSRQ